MTASNLIKVFTFALVLTVVYSTVIPESALITLGSLVRQDAPDNETAANETAPNNSTAESNETVSTLPTVTDPADNKTEEEKPEENKPEGEDEHAGHDHSGDKDKNATAGGNSTTNATESNASAPCFPANAQVTLENGFQKLMSELTIGDKVAVGNGKFSEVFMFTHRLSDVRYKFVEMHTSNGIALRATEGHYVYASGKYIAAGGVRIGDTLELADGSSVAVTDIKTVMDTGLYNPQTAHGDIIVNGVRASTFTTAIQPKFAHAALAPLRAVFARLGLVCTAFESGADMAANSLPSGSVIA